MTDSKMDEVKDDRKLRGKTNFIGWKREFERSAKANDILEYLSSPPSHTHASRNTISPRISASPSRHTSPYYKAGYPHHPRTPPSRQPNRIFSGLHSKKL
jgi:hypothetical protein